MDDSQNNLIRACKVKLLQAREERINTLKALSSSLAIDMTGDEADIAKSINDQNMALSQRERLLGDLREIDLALDRIENGSFGICEETEEAIEPNRLLAFPWTRLSLHGAEIREKQKKKFA